ncbi:MAG TPA: DJ-1/PfpI family protein [Gammaproteobacteria bacterium]|nr:DJ-1/PfpI family protein [Gammaproteobacteria bacterium]
MTTALALSAASANSAAKKASDDGIINVAVVLSDHIQVIAFAGPWKVFQDVSVKNGQGKSFRPYHLYTVAPTDGPIHTTGTNGRGMTIVPDYTFADAPAPDIVVLAPQAGGPGLTAWLKQLHAKHKTIMSVGQGARTLARAGLLQGKDATLHHFDYGHFANDFPDINVVRQVRYVQADPTTFTAAGMTSGIDLALHLVAKRFGQEVAQQTADYMEYTGTAWKTNKTKAYPLPVRHMNLSGKLAPDAVIVLHMAFRGASLSGKPTTDIPAWNVTAVPTSVKFGAGQWKFKLQINGQPATFTGQVQRTTGGIKGALVYDGKSYPLTLRPR